MPSVERWSSTGSLKDGQLMSQRHGLEGDRHRPAGEGAEERPETDHKNHRHFLAGGISSERESRSDQRGAESLKFSPGKQNGRINRDRGWAVGNRVICDLIHRGVQP
jgi:hypothetical protein